VPHGAAHELPARLVELADLQRRMDAQAAISTLRLRTQALIRILETINH
jgi:hypothetical protein